MWGFSSGEFHMQNVLSGTATRKGVDLSRGCEFVCTAVQTVGPKLMR